MMNLKALCQNLQEYTFSKMKVKWEFSGAEPRNVSMC